jgi:hypothetical protein
MQSKCLLIPTSRAQLGGELGSAVAGSLSSWFLDMAHPWLKAYAGEAVVATAVLLTALERERRLLTMGGGAHTVVDEHLRIAPRLGGLPAQHTAPH